MSDQIKAKPGQQLEVIGADGMDRRGPLKCMAWAGAARFTTI